MSRIIVSRHPATIEWLRKNYPQLRDVPVVAQATPEDVAGKVVVGNVPLHLAARAVEVRAVEFTGTPPRGQEYGPAEMEAAGAVLRCYIVRPLGECR